MRRNKALGVRDFEWVLRVWAYDPQEWWGLPISTRNVRERDYRIQAVPLPYNPKKHQGSWVTYEYHDTYNRGVGVASRHGIMTQSEGRPDVVFGAQIVRDKIRSAWLTTTIDAPDSSGTVGVECVEGAMRAIGGDLYDYLLPKLTPHYAPWGLPAARKGEVVLLYLSLQLPWPLVHKAQRWHG